MHACPFSMRVYIGCKVIDSTYLKRSFGIANMEELIEKTLMIRKFKVSVHFKIIFVFVELILGVIFIDTNN